VPDQYEQYKDASSTPYWDLLVGLLSIAGILGGGLGAIYAIGYYSVDKDSQAWPLATTVIVLVAVNVAARMGRAKARKRH
jgi:ABC-type methionine transport system permease subunit